MTTQAAAASGPITQRVVTDPVIQRIISLDEELEQARHAPARQWASERGATQLYSA